MEMKLDYSDISFQNNGKLKLLIIVGTRLQEMMTGTLTSVTGRKISQ